MACGLSMVSCKFCKYFFRTFVFILVVCIYLSSLEPQSRKSEGRNLIEELKDPKDLKKLLRTKNNVMILYTSSAKSATASMVMYSEVALHVKGEATLVIVDCSGEGKKICKKMKVNPEPIVFKHYKDGNFHKDYDRKDTVQSMANFLKNPTGDAPWEEDDSAKDVLHVADPSALEKLLHREKLPILVMFYAPWCQFCQRLKPDYADAATELRGHSVLAAMDVNKAENSVVSRHFNISGFPTLLYFQQGHLKFKYEGPNNKDDIVKFMKNPEKPAEKPKEEEWSETESDVVHLTVDTFDSIIQSEPSVLVMFYAPWCGHCKKMKPEYVEAAAKMKQNQIPGILAAVDATKEKAIGERFKISGYPSVKYFKDGQLAFDANVRIADKIVEFMKDPKEPPPPPAPELPWNQTESDVLHLDEESFKVILKRKKHVLVMFYAPWCGHCKKSKPEYERAALHFKEDPKVEFAAVDCTQFHAICTANEVAGYPTFKYFNYYKVSKPYDGGRTEKDFIQFMEGILDPSKAKASPPAPAATSPEEWWQEIPGSQHVALLSSTSFDTHLQKEDSLLVMFYAPWCGHCKSMKPAYAEAAERLIKENVSGKLAAVDAVAERDLATRFNIRGFPTVKYFRKGKFLKDYDQKRTTEDLVDFMKNSASAKDEL